jgi:C4-type Zn-finger protein
VEDQNGTGKRLTEYLQKKYISQSSARNGDSKLFSVEGLLAQYEEDVQTQRIYLTNVETNPTESAQSGKEVERKRTMTFTVKVHDERAA